MKEADPFWQQAVRLVKSAYSSGKPAIGVGPGNVPAIIDDSADILLALTPSSIPDFDNGMIWPGQAVIVTRFRQGKEEFRNRGCYFLNKEG